MRRACVRRERPNPSGGAARANCRRPALRARRRHLERGGRSVRRACVRSANGPTTNPPVDEPKRRSFACGLRRAARRSQVRERRNSGQNVRHSVAQLTLFPLHPATVRRCRRYPEGGRRLANCLQALGRGLQVDSMHSNDNTLQGGGFVSGKTLQNTSMPIVTRTIHASVLGPFFAPL